MGYPKISLEIKESLQRQTPRAVRVYRGGTVSEQYVDLINSFSRRDMERYEHLYRRWGLGSKNINTLFEKVQQRGIVSGPIYELAKLRTQDRYVHQKALAMLRYRWSNYKDMTKQRINDDSEKVWLSMARSIKNRGRQQPRVESKKWKSKDGMQRLVMYLKDLWQQQSGRCAESGLEMLLEIGTGNPNKCSPDRIDSSKPYDPENIRLVCHWVNSMKMDTPQPEFEQRIKILYEAMAQRTS